MHNISILIPLYNGIEFIEECLNSVKSQSYKNWEVIIGINGHTKDDETYKIAKLYENEKIKVLLYDTVGKANTLNKMVEDCSYDIICLLDIDDYWKPNKLEKQLNFIDTYDIVGTRTVYIINGKKINMNNIPIGEINEFILCNPIITSSMMLHKNDCKWEDTIYEDYDLVLRLASERKRFYNIAEHLTLHRIHKASFYNSNKDNEKYRFILVKKWKNLILNNNSNI